MTKTWETKKNIMELLQQRQMNVGEISRALNLSQSTASEHVAELIRIGAVSEVYNPYIKKWKYVKLNPEFDIQKHVRGEPQQFNLNKSIVIGAVIVLAALGIAVLAFSHSGAAAGSGQQTTLPITLTDPPIVPAGTQALVIDYTAVKAEITVNGINQWVNASGSGTLNLMSLINQSQVIATANVPKNIELNAVSFDVNSARIQINGTYYNLTLPTHTFIANVASSGNSINATTTALIDLSPTVLTIYEQNATVFVMVPSLKAIVVGNSDVHVSVGHKQQLTAAEIDNINQNSTLSITGAKLSTFNNITSISVALVNSGNSPITIRHMVIYGNFSTVISSSAQSDGEDVSTAGAVHSYNLPTIFDASVSDQVSSKVSETGSAVSGATAGIGAGVNGAVSGSDNGGQKGNGDNGAQLTVNGNSSAAASQNANATIDIVVGSIHVTVPQAGGTLIVNGRKTHIKITDKGELGSLVSSNLSIEQHAQAQLESELKVGENVDHFDVMDFRVAQNGTLQVLGSQSDEQSGNGYVIAPGATATLTFTGKVAVGDGRVSISFMPDANYKIVVASEGIGQDNGAAAKSSTNVTASAS